MPTYFESSGQLGRDVGPYSTRNSSATGSHSIS